nr:prolyl oligopeptidase family serine peptidase [uncultured Prevotella sp.]
MKKSFILIALTAGVLNAGAQVKTTVTEFNMAGPFAVQAPVGMDSVDVNGRKFDEKSLLGGLALSAEPTTVFSGKVLPSLKDSKSVGILSFFVNNKDYVKGSVSVKGPKNYKLFVDGQEAGGEVKLSPEHHTLAIKYLAEPSDTDSIQVTMDMTREVVPTLSKKHPYMVHDLTDGKRMRGISLSADGKYVVVSYQTTARGGNSRWDYELREVKSQRLLRYLSKNVTWMPRSTAYIEEEYQGDKRVLFKVDPLTGQRTQWAYDIPRESYVISPTEDYLIISCSEEGPKEDADVYQVLEMDDRQPGWRSRSYLKKYDLKTGICQRITFGHKGEYLYDISQDGKKLLIVSSYSRLAKRPTEVEDVYIMDAQTLKMDTVLQGEGFLGGCSFSPDATQILFRGNPEAFNRIGCQLPENVTPSMTEYELFLYDIASKKVTPLTKDFDPSVENYDWSLADGQIYLTAEDRDYVNMFVLNPKTGKITKLPIKGDYAYRYDLAAHASVVGYLSYKTMEPASAYVMTLNSKAVANSKLSSLNSQLFFDGKTALGDAEIGTCEDWNFTNSRGDTVYGRLYLPKDFDATKKYPMIVYYYGGCSPVSRYFESPYAPQYWNSLGYVAYIIEPSGATGFGQEWASRHVNTAGRGPAEDIIEGTKRICEAHPFINKDKIGCMGASYGGFMTQYLQTQTDIFAAAVSHAGIANHTSYWGEGYWGYNYSEVSMANSYPWSHRDLYVNQSPLFNADKIHTPLLLLHGDADTNVPLIESLQMFTALKLLGREVALVQVKGENHHILEYSKKEKWLATQMAWFARWLKDDPTWWDALYPKKHL